ncbi:MAG: hypothetical protein ACKOC8_08835 [Pirellulales bacterium]
MPAAGTVSAVAASLPLLLRLEARRAAAWIAMAITAVSVAACGEGPASFALALACGGLAAVAAVGDLPRIDACPGVPSACLLARIAWPLAGTFAVAGASELVTVPVWPSACAAALGIVIVAVLRVVGADAAAAVAARQAADPLAGIALLRRDAHRPVFGHGWNDRLVMAAALAAMVVCYFLVPEAAPWYALIAGGLFVLLTIPAVTCGSAVVDRTSSLLVRTIPGCPGLPGTVTSSLRAVAIAASLLGWPALVAAVLRSDRALAPAGPVAALAVLAVLAATTAAIVSGAGARGMRGETTRAVAMAAVAAFLLAAHAAGFPYRPACAVEPAGGTGASRNRC